MAGHDSTSDSRTNIEVRHQSATAVTGAQTITRRDAMHMTVSAAAVAAFTAPASAHRVTDPIFAAIKAHRTAWAEFLATIRATSRLEKELPGHKRRWSATVEERQPPRGHTDDPRWIGNQLAVLAASDSADEAALTLLHVEPATLAGVIALLDYAIECGHGSDERLPTDLDEDDSDTVASHWSYFVHKTLASALREIAA
jgi:hypothetical protein